MGDSVADDESQELVSRLIDNAFDFIPVRPGLFFAIRERWPELQVLVRINTTFHVGKLNLIHDGRDMHEIVVLIRQWWAMRAGNEGNQDKVFHKIIVSA
jgi:hypothetical protein